MSNLEVKIPGFENVESFLRYCEIHSQTPEALFSRKHARILYSMIGLLLSDYYAKPIPDFIHVNEIQMKVILERVTTKDPDRLYI